MEIVVHHVDSSASNVQAPITAYNALRDISLLLVQVHIVHLALMDVNHVHLLSALPASITIDYLILNVLVMLMNAMQYSIVIDVNINWV